MSDKTLDKYTLTARALHWISAAVILWATLAGIYMVLWAGPETAAWISAANISITTLLVPVFALRIVYRFLGPKPTPLAVPRAERRAAAVGHALLYGVTVVVLASGVLMMEKDIQVFSWFSIPQPLEHAGLNRVFFGLHRVSTSVLAILILGHVAAVFRHQLRGRSVLRRMTWTRSGRAGRTDPPEAAGCEERRLARRGGLRVHLVAGPSLPCSPNLSC